VDQVTKNIIVMDIDGCCVDPAQRLPYLKAGDYAKYDSLWYTDEAIPQGIATYKFFLQDPNYRCVFITSRGEYTRKETLWILAKYFGPLIDRAIVLMRNNDFLGNGADSNVPENLIKPYLLKRAGMAVEDVFLAFDDRDACVQGWRDVGVICYQLAPGNF
jgi:hypothetical protein